MDSSVPAPARQRTLSPAGPVETFRYESHYWGPGDRRSTCQSTADDCLAPTPGARG